MGETQPSIPGFAPDPENPNTGIYTDRQGSSTRVFLKRSRKPERQATEIAALALLREQAAEVPVPRLVNAHSDASGSFLILSYEAGVNLADILSPSPAAPPLPPWYQSFLLSDGPSIQDLAPLLAGIGRAVRAMHAVRLDQCGKLVGHEPNPYRGDTRAFTHQEFNHRSQVGVEKGFLPPLLAQELRHWVSRGIDCLSASEPACFIHCDLHAGNVRVFQDPAAGDWRLRAIYDFEMARGWLPEWDLASLHWDLAFLEADAGLAWRSFQDGYGMVDSNRLRLFECLRAVTAVAFTDRYPVWGAWSLNFLERVLHNAV